MSDPLPACEASPRGSKRLRARRIGIDAHHETVVFMRSDCRVCRSEGFGALARVVLRCGDRRVIATLFQVTSDVLAHEDAGLSESAWKLLDAHDGGTPSRRRVPVVCSVSTTVA